MSPKFRLFFARLALFGLLANMAWSPAAQATPSTDVAAMAICSINGTTPTSGHGPSGLSPNHCQYCHDGNSAMLGPPLHAPLLTPAIDVKNRPIANQEYAASRLQRADAQARAPPAILYATIATTLAAV